MNKAWLQWALGDLGKPSVFLDEQRSSGIIFHPQLHALINCPQQPEHHPEGDVYEHTMMVCDIADEIADRDDLLLHQQLTPYIRTVLAFYSRTFIMRLS